MTFGESIHDTVTVPKLPILGIWVAKLIDFMTQNFDTRNFWTGEFSTQDTLPQIQFHRFSLFRSRRSGVNVVKKS